MFTVLIVSWTTMLVVASFLVSRNPKFAIKKSVHIVKAEERIETIRKMEDTNGSMMMDEC